MPIKNRIPRRKLDTKKQSVYVKCFIRALTQCISHKGLSRRFRES